MKLYFLTVLLFAGFTGFVTAQKAPIKFGKIDKADLENNVYAPDSSAAAVVLCDYGYFSANSLQTIRILRIKILKKEGYPIANQSFSLDNKTDIKGITYNLEANEIVETKLKNESIYKTRITEDYYEMRVAMPNVKVGSIIDIQFTFYGIPRSWEFQQEIPVEHSELYIEYSPHFNFTKSFYGFLRLKESTNNHWIAEKMPAFKEEPFISSSKNYKTRMEIGLDFGWAERWESIIKALYEYTYFGVALNSDAYMKDIAKEIKEKGGSKDDLLMHAYDYIKNVKWNKQERLVTEKPLLNAVLKEGKGNSAEINLALIQLLRKLDFKAGPVVLSTRENGILLPFQPNAFKINYVIAAVFREKDTLLLDATEEHCPYNLLPFRNLNGQGEYIEKDKNFPVQLQSKKKDRQMVAFNFNIGDDLSLKGNISYLKGDYAALEFRNKYDNYNTDDEYIASFKEGKTGFKIISHSIDDLDSIYKPIKETFEIAINNSITDIGGELYFNPLLFEQIKENPFKTDKREYPIDYGYASDKTIIVNYTIPLGYKAENIPAPASLRLPGNAASFVCQSTVSEGKLSITYKLNINKAIFLQTEYADLREFYNQVIAKQAEPVVLKKL